MCVGFAPARWTIHAMGATTTRRVFGLGPLVCADGAAPDRVWVAKAGAGYHPDSGDFEITSEHLDQIVANFDRSKERRPKPVAIDVDHALLYGAPTLEERAAVGWVESLERDGDDLFAKVEWLPDTAEAVAAGKYRFTSPVIHFDWTDTKTAEPIGAVLDSLAITNRPVFDDGVPLVASRACIGDLSAVDGVQDVTVRGPKDAGTAIVTLSLETPQMGKPETPETESPKTVSLSRSGATVEVEISEDTIRKLAADLEAAEALAAEAEQKAEEAEAEVAELSKQVPAEDAVVLSRAEWEKTATTAAEAKAELDEMRAEARREKAFNEGRIDAAQMKSDDIVAASRDEKTWSLVLSLRPPNSAWDTSGPKGSGREDNDPTDADSPFVAAQRVAELIKEAASSDAYEGMTPQAAFTAARRAVMADPANADLIAAARLN